MNTKNLLTLKTILETGSFQKAADKLNYTQSTVTFQMKQLEEELSLKLFEKIGRKMERMRAGMYASSSPVRTRHGCLILIQFYRE